MSVVLVSTVSAAVQYTSMCRWYWCPLSVQQYSIHRRVSGIGVHCQCSSTVYIDVSVVLVSTASAAVQYTSTCRWYWCPLPVQQYSIHRCVSGIGVHCQCSSTVYIDVSVVLVSTVSAAVQYTSTCRVSGIGVHCQCSSTVYIDVSVVLVSTVSAAVQYTSTCQWYWCPLSVQQYSIHRCVSGIGVHCQCSSTVYIDVSVVLVSTVSAAVQYTSMCQWYWCPLSVQHRRVSGIGVHCQCSSTVYIDVSVVLVSTASAAVQYTSTCRWYWCPLSVQQYSIHRCVCGIGVHCQCSSTVYIDVSVVLVSTVSAAVQYTSTCRWYWCPLSVQQYSIHRCVGGIGVHCQCSSTVYIDVSVVLVSTVSAAVQYTSMCRWYWCPLSVQQYSIHRRVGGIGVHCQCSSTVYIDVSVVLVSTVSAAVQYTSMCQWYWCPLSVQQYSIHRCVSGIGVHCQCSSTVYIDVSVVLVSTASAAVQYTSTCRWYWCPLSVQQYSIHRCVSGIGVHCQCSSTVYIDVSVVLVSTVSAAVQYTSMCQWYCSSTVSTSAAVQYTSTCLWYWCPLSVQQYIHRCVSGIGVHCQCSSTVYIDVSVVLVSTASAAVQYTSMCQWYSFM